MPALQLPLHTLVQLGILLVSSSVAAFTPLINIQGPPTTSLVVSVSASEGSVAVSDDDSSTSSTIPPAGLLNDKDIFLQSLDDLTTLNQATKERTSLLNTLIDNKRIVAVGGRTNTNNDEASSNNKNGQDTSISAATSIDKPGRLSAFAPVAPGKWRVIYAPHMTTMANLAGGSFQVEYDLNEDGTMESHAKYDFPTVGRGYLSVSGTYGSVDDTTCRVDFDEAWVRSIGIVSSSSDDKGEEDLAPYATIDDVPDSIIKTIIRRLGRLLFFDQVSVFPVSFLDENLIVFDFELLGTRITAMKV